MSLGGNWTQLDTAASAHKQVYLSLFVLVLLTFGQDSGLAQLGGLLAEARDDQPQSWGPALA